MASSYPGRSAAYTPDLIDLSDPEELFSEDIISISEEEPTQRELNDYRLTQAINYLTEEGGDDSPATFIDRVDRIDEALLQQLPQQGRDFDTQLYRRARAMVRGVQREFEEAAQQASSSMLETGESEEDLPQYYTPSAAQALYRGEEFDEDRSDVDMITESEDNVVAVESQKKKSKLQPSKGKEEVVDRIRQFHYGGPDNEYEDWHKDFLAALPFPETFQMAHWESIKIDYDLSESAKKEKASGKVVETNIPFDLPVLKQYKKLPLYESGSRFKLPVPGETVQNLVVKLGTKEKLADVVHEFNQGDEEAELAKDYVPRMFLEAIDVGEQEPLKALRRALARTPTKSRPVQKGSTTTIRITETNSTATPRSTATIQTPTKQTPVPPQPGTPDSTVIQKAIDDGVIEQRAADVATTPARRSALVRIIQEQRKRAVKESPRRQSGISTAPPTPRGQPPSPTPIRPKSPRVVIPVKKRGRGRPRKDQIPLPQQPETEVTAPRTTRSTATKRKLSIGAKSYTPEQRRKSVHWSEDKEESMVVDNATPKTRPSAKKPTVVEISSGESIDELAPAKKTPKKTTPTRATPAKTTTKPVTPAKKLNLGRQFNRQPLTSPMMPVTTRSKAAAAGAQVRRGK